VRRVANSGMAGNTAGRFLSAVIAACVVLLSAMAGSASAQGDSGSGYSVTFVALSCPTYTDIFANRARNDIQESLKDLGPDTQYTSSDFLVNPDEESKAPQDRCSPLPNWRFTLGTGIQAEASVGVWGSLSIVTNPYDTPITTQASTPLLNQNGQPIGNAMIAGATTIRLTDAQREQASHSGQLWAQGGTPTDPVLAGTFPGPEYGFGALRCAVDALNGDNVEYIYFPAGVTHVFCYGIYVKPPPTAGTITIRKVVTGAPAGDNPSFPFNGNISFDPNGFQLANGQSMEFFRAGGADWDVTEGSVANYERVSSSCTATTANGAPGKSTATYSESTISVHLVATEHVTCTYTNRYVPPAGGLTIRKITLGGVGSFNYVVSPASGGTSHRPRATTTEPGIPVDAEPSLLSLAPGTYTLRERPVSTPGGHWRLVSVHCDDVSESSTRPVTVEIHSGVGTICTFVNRFVAVGAISISKISTGGTGTATFVVGPNSGPPAQYLQHATTTAEGVPADATPATPADATNHLRLGPYTIIEQLPPSTNPDSWALASVQCNGVAEPFAQGTVHVTLTRANPSVHCTFTDFFNHVSPPVPPPVVPPGPPITPNPPHPNVTPPIYALSDLVVTKQASAAVVTVGHPVSYRITVKNLGPDPAQRVVITDQHPGTARVVSVHNPVGPCRIGATVVCELNTIKPGASGVLTVTLVPTAASSRFVNRAVAGTATGERTLANNTDTATVRVIAPPPPPRGRG
jgi:uncharacterized repeat protein (TIGR01451 family)